MVSVTQPVIKKFRIQIPEPLKPTKPPRRLRIPKFQGSLQIQEIKDCKNDDDGDGNDETQDHLLKNDDDTVTQPVIKKFRIQIPQPPNPPRKLRIPKFQRSLQIQEIKDCKNDDDGDGNDETQDHLLNVYDDICGLSSTNEDDFYKLLKCALRFNNFSYFKKAVDYGEQHAVLNVNYVYPDDLEETLLDKASRDGQTIFVKLLLKKGAKLNRINKMHNRAPIHFATEKGHTDTLEALLKEPTINPNLQAGHQTALHIAVRRNDLICARLLLKYGASASIPNSKGLTALHLAVSRNKRELVELILNNSQQYPDIDTYKDYKNQTTRKVIQDNLPDIIRMLPPIKCKKLEVNVYDLKYYLIANDETSFLKSMRLVETEIFLDAAEELLEIAVQHNFYKSVIEILQNLRNLQKLKKRQFSLRKAAEVAVLQSHSDILQELLHEEPEIANDLLLNACQQLGIPDERQRGRSYERLACLRLILEQKGVDVRRTDNKGNTPLHYAARANCTEAIMLLLHQGSYIGHMNKFNVPPIVDMPAALTDFYSYQGYVCMNKMIKFDYRNLMPNDVQKKHDENHQTTREMEVIQYVASNNDLKYLLKHPVLSFFLLLKWYIIKDILYFNLVFHGIYCALLLVYILGYLGISANENRTQTINNNFNASWENYLQISSIFLRILISLLLLPFISWEIFQYFSRPWHHLRNVKNLLLNNTIIVLTVILICGVNHYIVNFILILLSIWKLIKLNNQYKDMFISFEKNCELQKIPSSYRIVNLLYVTSILMFVLTIILTGSFFKINANFFNSMYLFFTTGETADIFTIETYSTWNHSMFTLFFFSFSIFMILFNAFNGLMEINSFRQITAKSFSKAELTRLISSIDVIAHIENMTVGRYYFCCGKSRWNPFNSLLCKKIFLFPHYMENGIYFQSLRNDDRKGI